jgi:hypothetical protein
MENKKQIDNITYFFRGISAIISIRKVIEKGTYIIENNSFKISVDVILTDNIFRVSNGETRTENEIFIQVSQNILFESSDDFLIFFFMWCWFQRFENTDKKFEERFELSDVLSFNFVTENVKSIRYSSILVGMLDFWSRDTIENKTKLTHEQESRIERFKRLVSNHTIEKISNKTDVSPVEIILNIFQTLPKDDFSKWLIGYKDELLFLEQELIGNAIKEYIKSNQKK